MTRAAIYSRYSTERQTDRSIEDQKRNCHERAAREGWMVVSQYADRGISGATANRPDYQRMLAAAFGGEFDLLLVDDLSRLSRDEVEMKRVVRRFVYLGLRLVGVSDGFDTASKGHKLHASVRGLINDIYLDDLREKTHRGLTGRALKGYSTGGLAYGYRPVPGEDGTRWEVDPAQAEVVRTIFAWYAAGWSHRAIAAELNRRGVPALRGKTWCQTAIYGDVTKGTGLLNNELYVGRRVWNRSRWERDPDTGRRRRLLRPESEWIVREEPDLRIVDQATWDRVKARQKHQRNDTVTRRQRCQHQAGPGRGPKFPFSGLLKCGRCGANYIVVDAYQYGCASNRNRGEAACANSLRAPRRRIETRLLDAIVHGLFEADEVARFQDALRQRLTSATDMNTERQALTSELRRIRRETANLVQAIKDGIKAETVRDELDRCERQRVETEHRLAALDRAGNVGATIPDRLDGYAAALAGLRRLVDQDATAAREQIRALVGQIRLLPYEGHLVAYLTGDLFCLLGLTAETSALVLWREPEAGTVAGFGRFAGDDLMAFEVGRNADDEDDDSTTPPPGGGDGRWWFGWQ